MGRRLLVVMAVAATALLGGIGGAPAAPAAAAALWRPDPGAVPDLATYVHMDSEPGDFVGQGIVRDYDRADADITVTSFGSRAEVIVLGDTRWHGIFTAPLAQGKVEVGAQLGLGDPDVEGEVRWFGDGRSCNTNRGWFVVDDVAYDGATLTKLHLRFEQQCLTSSAPLHGEIHWEADDPNPGPPTPTQPIPPTVYRPAATSVPATGSYLYLNGQPGSFVGDGEAFLYTGDELLSRVELEANSGATFDMRYRDGTDSWLVRVQASNRADGLLPGFYRRLMRYPFHNPVVGGFSASGNGRGCNTSWSDVAIDELDSRSGRITDIHLRFAQRCGMSSLAFRGELRWQEVTPTEGVLAPPTGVTAEQDGSSATVAWPAVPDAEGAPVRGYEVTTYREGLAVATKVVDAAATSTTVAGLDATATHTFKVATITQHGTGERSRASDAPPVVLPIVTSIAPTSGPRTGGTVVAVRGVGLDGATDVRFGDVPAPSFTVVSPTRIDAVAPGLTLGAHEVSVTDAVGRSEPGPAFTSRPLVPGPPSGVTATAAWARATASWSPPSDPGDGPRTGYVVRAVPDGDGDDVIVQVGAEATTAAVTGLVPGATYRLRVAALSGAGEGTSATSEPITLPAPDLGPFATVEALTAQQHLDFTGREATGGEIATAAAAVRSGQVTTAQLVAGFRDRPEWGGRRSGVIRLYSAYFLRRPDGAGLDYWAVQRASGWSLQRVSSSFAASPEFRTTYGRLTDDGFVRRVYLNVLGRQPDAAGLAYWKGRLAGGTSRGAVMVGFSESPENVARTRASIDVVLLHDAMIGTVPTASEHAQGLATVSGTGGVAAYAGRLLGSPEYAARF